MCLPTDLFLQVWRPSAFAIGGIVNWISLFLVGMLFPFIVVRSNHLKSLSAFHLMEKSGMNQSIALLFEVTKCYRKGKKVKQLDN